MFINTIKGDVLVNNELCINQNRYIGNILSKVNFVNKICIRYLIKIFNIFLLVKTV